MASSEKLKFTTSTSKTLRGLNGAKILTGLIKISEYPDIIFSDGQKAEDLPEPPQGRNFWENKLTKINYYDYSKDMIKNILNERIGFLLDYCQRFSENKLNENELNKPKPSNFKGPYLPVPAEVEKISKLSTFLKSETVFSKNSSNEATRYITPRHLRSLIKQWERFQEEFGIYDLRPLLGHRCLYIEKNENGKLDFTFYRLLNDYTFKEFISYLGTDVTDLRFKQVESAMRSLCDYYIDGHFHVLNRSPVLGLELNLMDMIYEKYKRDSQVYLIMSALIGERSAKSYTNNSLKYYKFRSVPFKDGPWDKEENLQLLCNIAAVRETNDLNKLINCPNKMSWEKIFNNIKVRSIDALFIRWYTMSQELRRTLYKSEAKTKDPPFWTSEDTIKLIDSVYHSDATNVRDIDWAELVLKFPGYTHNGLRRKLNLLKSRVPSKLKDFDDALEYLYHKVKPIYKLKDIRQKKQTHRLDLIVSYQKEMNNHEVTRLKNFFQSGWEEDTEEERSLISGEEDFRPAIETSARHKDNSNMPVAKRSNDKCIPPPQKRRKTVSNEQNYWQIMMNRSNYKSRYQVSEIITKDKTKMSFVPMFPEFSCENDQTSSTDNSEKVLSKPVREIESVVDSVTANNKHGHKKRRRESDEATFQEKKNSESLVQPQNYEVTHNILRNKEHKHKKRKEAEGSPLNEIPLDYRKNKKVKRKEETKKVENVSPKKSSGPIVEREQYETTIPPEDDEVVTDNFGILRNKEHKQKKRKEAEGNPLNENLLDYRKNKKVKRKEETKEVENVPPKKSSGPIVECEQYETTIPPKDDEVVTDNFGILRNKEHKHKKRKEAEESPLNEIPLDYRKNKKVKRKEGTKEVENVSPKKSSDRIVEREQYKATIPPEDDEVVTDNFGILRNKEHKHKKRKEAEGNPLNENLLDYRKNKKVKRKEETKEVENVPPKKSSGPIVEREQYETTIPPKDDEVVTDNFGILKIKEHKYKKRKKAEGTPLNEILLDYRKNKKVKRKEGTKEVENVSPKNGSDPIVECEQYETTIPPEDDEVVIDNFGILRNKEHKHKKRKEAEESPLNEIPLDYRKNKKGKRKEGTKEVENVSPKKSSDRIVEREQYKATIPPEDDEVVIDNFGILRNKEHKHKKRKEAEGSPLNEIPLDYGKNKKVKRKEGTKEVENVPPKKSSGPIVEREHYETTIPPEDDEVVTDNFGIFRNKEHKHKKRKEAKGSPLNEILLDYRKNKKVKRKEGSKEVGNVPPKKSSGPIVEREQYETTIPPEDDEVITDNFGILRNKEHKHKKIKEAEGSPLNENLLDYRKNKKVKRRNKGSGKCTSKKE